MNPIMYMLPDAGSVRKCVITSEVVDRGAAPLLELSEQAPARGRA